jgi:hypothetical protein
LPEGWIGEKDVEDSIYCPDHLLEKSWFDSVCPGCIDGLDNLSSLTNNVDTPFLFLTVYVLFLLLIPDTSTFLPESFNLSPILYFFSGIN